VLSVDNLWKTYDGKPLLCGVSFDVGEGETVCLLGPSGSGKSTILRIVAGLEEAERGRVVWDGADMTHTPVHERNFGLMFQDYALFPHRSVAENVAFGLRMRNLPAEEVGERVKEGLARVNLTGLERRRVTDLSGGEQQRVALARALAPNPRLLMLDEPLGALDRTLREQLEEELRRILHESRVPALYVTHDQEEAFALADRLVLIQAGEVVQAGAPREVYERPVSVWVARFFGLGNIVAGRVAGADPLVVETAIGKFMPVCPHGGHPAGSTVQILLRPRDARMAATVEAGVNRITGRVVDVLFNGQGYRVSLECGGQELQFVLEEKVGRGEELRLEVKAGGIVCLEAKIADR